MNIAEKVFNSQVHQTSEQAKKSKKRATRFINTKKERNSVRLKQRYRELFSIFFL